MSQSIYPMSDLIKTNPGKVDLIIRGGGKVRVASIRQDSTAFGNLWDYHA